MFYRNFLKVEQEQSKSYGFRTVQLRFWLRTKTKQNAQYLKYSETYKAINHLFKISI